MKVGGAGGPSAAAYAQSAQIQDSPDVNPAAGDGAGQNAVGEADEVAKKASPIVPEQYVDGMDGRLPLDDVNDATQVQGLDSEQASRAINDMGNLNETAQVNQNSDLNSVNDVAETRPGGAQDPRLQDPYQQPDAYDGPIGEAQQIDKNFDNKLDSLQDPMALDEADASKPSERAERRGKDSDDEGGDAWSIGPDGPVQGPDGVPDKQQGIGAGSQSAIKNLDVSDGGGSDGRIDGFIKNMTLAGLTSEEWLQQAIDKAVKAESGGDD